MNIAGVYEIYNSVNGKRYIGSAVNMERRFAVHRHSLLRGKHHSRYLQNACGKYGFETFIFRPLLICSKSELLFYEQRAFDVLRPEYNVCPKAGNALGVRWTDEARARHSVLQKANPAFGGRKHTPESLKKLSLSKLGNTHTKGKKRNPDAVAKTAAAHTGMKRSAETRAKIAARAKGRQWTDGAKAKLSATLRQLSDVRHATDAEWQRKNEARMAAKLRGRKRPRTAEHSAKLSAALTGRKATPEHRANQSAAQLGKKHGPYKPMSQETRARAVALRLERSAQRRAAK